MDPSWRASGQEAVVAIAELMETFRETEQSCPGFCDTFLQKLNTYFKKHLLHLSRRAPPTSRPNVTKSSIA